MPAKLTSTIGKVIELNINSYIVITTINIMEAYYKVLLSSTHYIL